MRYTRYGRIMTTFEQGEYRSRQHPAGFIHCDALPYFDTGSVAVLPWRAPMRMK
ncbi:MAG: hypothetical protein KAY09_05935 [Nitrospira sp.]|nr:hypothetical protein [Nitrospira sp.]